MSLELDSGKQKMNKTITITFNPDISEAPYDEPLFLLFEDGRIHTGVKKNFEWIRYPGTKNEQTGDYDEFQPFGVKGDYGNDTFFTGGDPIGWHHFFRQQRQQEQQNN